MSLGDRRIAAAQKTIYLQINIGNFRLKDFIKFVVFELNSCDALRFAEVPHTAAKVHH